MEVDLLKKKDEPRNIELRWKLSVTCKLHLKEHSNFFSPHFAL